MQWSVTDLSTYVVRAPVPSDAPALGRMHCRVWQQTYADSMDPKAYAALSPERFEQGWHRRLHGVDDSGGMATGDQMILATHPQDGIVAMIIVGPGRDDDLPNARHVSTLNVAIEHHGTGLAQHLMAKVLGDGPAYLWVARGNDRAITFYERHGFTTDGRQTLAEDGITEMRMVRHGEVL